MTAIRTIVEPNKGRLQGAAARGPFDAIIGRRGVCARLSACSRTSVWQSRRGYRPSASIRDDEVLLDDSLRYVEGAVATRVDARVDVREGMPHGFLSGIGTLAASNQALDEIGRFLADRLNFTPVQAKKGD